MPRRVTDPSPEFGGPGVGKTVPEEHTAAGREGLIIGSVRLRAETATPGLARKFVASVLRGLIAPSDIEVVVLLASEVVTNAVIHAGTSVDLVVRRIRGGVQIEASDGAKQPPVVVVGPVTSESGRGMRMVAALSDDWGVIRTAMGKTVWFRWRPSLDPPTGSAGRTYSAGRREASSTVGPHRSWSRTSR
jgi:anti-sigma regulatory factor (Ser/Thr protein kinase)